MRILKLALYAIFIFPALALGAVQITDIKVENSRFSPNGDGAVDSSFVSFNLVTDLGWAALWIWVANGEGETVDTLASDEAVTPGEVKRVWDGRAASGEMAAEGNYVFRMYARAGEDTTPTFAAGTVLDVTAPGFSALVEPSPYTPDLGMADSLLSVSVLIDHSEADDWLLVTVTVEDLPETLCVRQLDLGDTTYLCTWDGRSYGDGVYPLKVLTSDRAGNMNQAYYAVDLDTEGPSLGISEPAQAVLNTYPERAAGFAYDRAGLDSLGFRFKEDLDFGPVNIEASGDTLYWYAAWPESLASDGSFELEIFARDIPGHTAERQKDVTIDTVSPESPVLSPLPESVSQPRLEVSGTCSARDSLFLYLNGEIAKKTTCSAGATFTIEITLEEGLNTVYAISKDIAGNQSSPSETLTVTYARSVGIRVPERFESGSVMDITLEKAADLITIRVFTLGGSYVATLVNPAPEIVGEMDWDLRDSEGKEVANGVYVMVFQIDYSDGDRKVEKKAVVVVR